MKEVRLSVLTLQLREQSIHLGKKDPRKAETKDLEENNMNENTTRIPRLRTLPQAMEEIKKADPDTAMTMRALRRMVNTGELPTIHIESKV